MFIVFKCIMFSLQNQLPDSMPSIFSSTYTPIAAAGTPAQIKHVSRLLAAQLNNAGLGPGATLAKSQKPALVRSLHLKCFHSIILNVFIVHLQLM